MRFAGGYRSGLLLMLGILLVAKFIFLPVISWQDAQIQELTAKKRQFMKVSKMVANQPAYEKHISELRAKLTRAQQFFYEDNNTTKLDIQRDLVELFQANEIEVTAFNWVIDSGDAVRVLRATLFFKGTTTKMIDTFWKIGRWPKFIKIIEWSQQMTGASGVDIGWTQGNVTLEFYAVKPEFNENNEGAVSINYPVGLGVLSE